MREVQIKIETVEVKARPRKLGEVRTVRRHGKRKFVFIKKWTWTIEHQPMVHVYDPDAFNELEKAYLNGIIGA